MAAAAGNVSLALVDMNKYPAALDKNLACRRYSFRHGFFDKRSPSPSSSLLAFAMSLPKPNTNGFAALHGSGPGSVNASSATMSSLKIKNTNVHAAPGVQLTQSQKVVIASILDLFTGYPTLAKLSLWSPTASFHDPLTAAEGRPRFAAQWYGLCALFRPIEMQSHTVTRCSAPTPPYELEFTMRNAYTVKGIGTTHVVESTVLVHVGPDGAVERVEDHWNGRLPEGIVSQVSNFFQAGPASTSSDGQLGGNGSATILGARPKHKVRGEWKTIGAPATASAFVSSSSSLPLRKNCTTDSGGNGGRGGNAARLIRPARIWVRTTNWAAEWVFGAFCETAWWWPFLTFRKLNAVAVPVVVKVPKTEEEDRRMQDEREQL